MSEQITNRPPNISYFTIKTPRSALINILAVFCKAGAASYFCSLWFTKSSVA